MAVVIAFNGTASPPPLELQAKTVHRLRFINISAFDTKRVRILADTTLQQWRAVAKDGADLPATQAIVRPAFTSLGPGETIDFEVTRGQAEVLTLEIATNPAGLHPHFMRVPIIVR